MVSTLKPAEILIVEDDPMDAELTIRALREKKMANDIFLVENGAEAIDFLFAKGKYKDKKCSRDLKVIFLDLKLPKMNGLEVLRILKSDPETRQIPVVIITSSSEDPDIREAYAIGANSYIVKPVGFEDFTKAIQNTGLYWLLVNKPPA